MFEIAILDDKLDEAMQTKHLLLHYLEKRNLDYDRIDIFQCGDALLHAPKSYDMLFLDIEVGEENGIEIARKLREEHPDMIIIVITSFIKYSMEGYKIHAARYLLKPVAASLLYSELDEVLSDMLEKPALILEDNKEQTRLYTNDIYYFESYGRKVQFHTRKEVFTSKESVSYWAMKLSKDFVECYKGIYVHVRYVEQISKDTLQLENQQILPLARRRAENVKATWIAYQEKMI